MSRLLHPELFEDMPVTGNAMANSIDSRADAVFDSARNADGSPVTVAIRTLNEAEPLEALLKDVNDQAHGGEIEIVVVDNESSDKTQKVAKSFGAEVVTLARGDFSYPKSMNLAMEASSHDNVFLTVGHALLSNTQSLTAGARQLEKTDVVGAFSIALPNYGASRTEKVLSIGTLAFLRNAVEIKKAGLGVLAATGAMLSKEAWEEFGKFDERYETGGEDTELARTMLEGGYKIIREPLLTVHHSHGLGPVNYAKQFKRWMDSLKGPSELDLNKVAKSRPDLDFF